jgi:hypothetical protein
MVEKICSIEGSGAKIWFKWGFGLIYEKTGLWGLWVEDMEIPMDKMLN